MNKALDMITLWLLIIGGLNWGLFGLGWWLGSADWNVVHMILGNWMMVEGLVYILVGLSGVYVAWMSVSKKSM